MMRFENKMVGFLVFNELYKMEKIWSSKIQKVQLL